MKLRHAQIGSTLIGLGLAGFGVYVGLFRVDSWTVWSVAVVLAPMGAGLLLALPGPTRRAVARMAPYVPFLEDPEADDG